MFELSILSYSLILAGTMFVTPFVVSILCMFGDFLWGFINREKSSVGEKIFDKLFCSPAIIQYKNLGWGRKLLWGFKSRYSNNMWAEDSLVKEYCLFSTKEKAEAHWKNDDRYFKWEIWFGIPVLVAFGGVCLQYIPLYFLLFISSVGVVFLLRCLRDLYKYVGKVKDKLDVHVEDKNAHK